MATCCCRNTRTVKSDCLNNEPSSQVNLGSLLSARLINRIGRDGNTALRYPVAHGHGLKAGCA
jgi:hypothetical protein